MPSFPPAVTNPALCLSILLSAFALCGCGRLGNRADLVCLNGPECELLDPPLITAQATSRVAYAVFEGLTAYDVKGEAGPGVAERWEISPDGLHYTFHLRHNALWSNGDPVTAEDFLYSWRRALLPETASEYAYQLYYVRGAKDFNEGKSKDFNSVGVRAPDPYTIEVTLENPTPFFLDLCAFTELLPVHRATVEDASSELWDEVFAVNVRGAITSARACIRSMMKTKAGRIIFLSSVVGEMGNAGQTAYAMTKAAVLGATRSIAREYASRNITVNAIAPGFVDTDMTHGLSEANKEQMLKAVPLGRTATAHEIAAACVYLASAEAAYVTGQVLRVNGGMHIS